LQSTVLYRWRKELFVNGLLPSSRNGQSTTPPSRERIAHLEKKIQIQTKDEVLAELMPEHVALKTTLGNFDREPGPTRCARSDHFVRRWSDKTAGRFIVWLDITASKFHDWRER
jgi:hypothetical protein